MGRLNYKNIPDNIYIVEIISLQQYITKKGDWLLLWENLPVLLVLLPYWTFRSYPIIITIVMFEFYILKIKKSIKDETS